MLILVGATLAAARLRSARRMDRRGAVVAVVLSDNGWMQASFLRLIRDLPAGTILVLAPSDRARRAWRRLALAQADPSRPQALPPFLTIEEWFAQLWQDARLLGRLPQGLDLAEPAIEAGLWPWIAHQQASMTSTEAQPIALALSEAYRLAQAHARPEQIAGVCSAEMRALVDVFERRLAAEGLMSRARLARAIAQAAPTLAGLLPSTIVRLPGLFTWPDQEDALARLCAMHGVELIEGSPVASTAHGQRRQARDEAEEQQAALDWVCALHEAGRISLEHPAMLVVPDLTREQGRWRRLLLERGLEANVSLGPALSSYPWAAVGFTLVEACFRPIAVEILQQALLHPRWGWSLDISRRWAEQARHLLMEGTQEIDLLGWFQRSGTPALADELKMTLGDFARPQVRRTRQQWAECFAAIIALLSKQAGVLDSATWQLREALLDAVGHWCALDRFLPPLSQSEAQAEWRAMTDRMPYQPQQTEAAGRIQILGLLESAGLPHGGLWCVGASDRVLPEATQLNPFLDPVWQRRQRVGLADAGNARLRGERLRELWQALGPELLVSCPQEVAGEPIAWSPLFTSWPCVDLPATTASRIEHAPHIEDELAPAPEAGTLNARSLEAQALCPRLGFAVSRLRLEPWPRAQAGIAPPLRGQIVHAVAERYGQAILGRRSEALAWSALQAALPDWIEAAFAEQAAALQALPRHLIEVEKQRLHRLFERFLEAESQRPSFMLVKAEEAMQAELNGVVCRLKVDRIDRLLTIEDRADQLIIDYKTGPIELDGLHDDRLSAPQLPLYALASGLDTVAGVAYQRLDDEGPSLIGQGEGPIVSRKWQDIDFRGLKERWRHALAALVSEWQRGEAALAPVAGARTCARCMAAGFCRVDALSDHPRMGDDAEEREEGGP